MYSYDYDAFEDAGWISVADFAESDHLGIEVAYFCRTLELPPADVSREPETFTIHISANSRYRLWVNGIDVLSGPEKGDRWRRYFETIDLSPYLRGGTNLLAAKVVAYPPVEAHEGDCRPPQWVVGNVAGPCLLVAAGSARASGLLDTGVADWKAWSDEAVSWKFFSITGWLGSMEVVDGKRIPHRWHSDPTVSSQWRSAAVRRPVKPGPWGHISPLPPVRRDIPLLYETQRSFVREMELGRGEWGQIRLGIPHAGGETARGETAGGASPQPTATVAPDSRAAVELDAGELTTGYFKLPLSGGLGATVRVLYAESYSRKDPDTGRRIKGRRDDNRSMSLHGHYDTYFPSGRDDVYQPFLMRTFRFVRIEVQTADRPLSIGMPTYLETGYPLDVQTEVTSESDPWVPEVWPLAVRTLKRCMHETYEDCPYYEQLQYEADTRLQVLFQLCLSNDTRLAERAVLDFHCSLLPEGILMCRSPSGWNNVIPQWAAHWIFIVEDVYRQTGNAEWVRQYRPTIDAILEWYRRKEGAYGLAEHLGYWDHVEHVAEWRYGVSPASAIGPSAVQNLVYVNVLLTAARLNDSSGRPAVATEYAQRARALLDAVLEHCWSADVRMIREGPECYEYSQHAQMWATLTGLLDAETAQSIMRQAVEYPEVRRCTYPFMFYLFRALEKTGQYHLTESLWDDWKEFPRLNLTTLPETPRPTVRSDCHAWSALPLYEFVRSFLGVRSAGPGWPGILVRPVCTYVEDVDGTVVTPLGPVEVRCRYNDGSMHVEGSAPVGADTVVVLPDGTRERFAAGGAFSCKTHPEKNGGAP